MTLSSEAVHLPVFSAPQVAPELCTAGLVLGVGRRDEDFVHGGVTHLLEHVVMHEIGRIPGLDVNAQVTLSTLEFVASGRPDRVAGFMQRVCALLADPPVEHLAVEARVLRAEEGDSGPGPTACMLGERYSAVDVGLAALEPPALLSITPDYLRAWAARHAVRGNAALWSVGELPDDTLQELERALPTTRTAPLRSRAPEARPTLPAWTQQAYVDVLTLTFETPTGAKSAVAVEIFRRRIEDELRHRRGLLYDVSLESDRLDDSRHHTAMILSVPPEQAPDIAKVLVETLQALADDGPTSHEVEHAIEDARAYLADPRNAEERLSAAAQAAVRGWTVRDSGSVRTELDDLTIDHVKEAVSGMRDTCLIGVPGDVDLRIDGLTALPQQARPAVEGTTYKRRLLGRAPLGARLIVGDDGVTLRDPDEGPITVLWPDVVGLVREPDAHHLVAVDGVHIPLAPGDWRGGDDLIATVLRHVPEALVVSGDPPTLRD